jgi:hypothetical protein
VPHLPYSIELHDSRLAGIEQRAGAAVLQLRPAYIHRDGKGWLQNADIVVGLASVDSVRLELPADVADGHLKTQQGPYHNLLGLPLSAPGEVLLTLEFFSNAELRVRGVSAEVVLHGEPEFLEDVV